VTSKPKFPTPARLMELRSVLLDGFDLGPIDREDLNEVVIDALLRAGIKEAVLEDPSLDPVKP
jgi:hypothetical protein